MLDGCYPIGDTTEDVSRLFCRQHQDQLHLKPGHLAHWLPGSLVRDYLGQHQVGSLRYRETPLAPLVSSVNAQRTCAYQILTKKGLQWSTFAVILWRT